MIKNKTYIEYQGLELELPFAPDNPDTVKVVETSTGFRVGFLDNDTDAVNPLEDCDGYGEIHHHPRSRYGRRDSEYNDILSLDQYGAPQLDEDKVQALWAEKVKALPAEVWIPAFTADADVPFEQFVQTCVRQLADEEAGDYTVLAQVCQAFASYAANWTFNYQEVREVTALIEQHLTWNWDEVCEICRKPWRKHAVLLDRYEHGLCQYSVSGTGPSCRFDSSSGEAVWVPDQCAEDEINRLAKVYDHAYIDETSYVLGRNLRYNLMVNGKSVKTSDDWPSLWVIAQDIASLRIKAGVPAFYDGDTLATEQIAEQACEIYTQWCNGEVYCVVTQDFDFKGEAKGSYDCCGGFYGSEWAEHGLNEEMYVNAKDKWEVYCNYGYTDERLEYSTCAFEHALRYVEQSYGFEGREEQHITILKNGSTEY